MGITRWLLACFALTGVSTVSAGPLVLAVAPGMEREGLIPSAYEALATVLSEAVGTPVAVARPGHPFVYQKGLVEDSYDFVFDAPHLIGWRLVTAEHRPLFKFTAERVYVLLRRGDDPRVRRLADVVGRRTCSALPPRLPGVMLLAAFRNPLRQPYLMESDSEAQTYRDVRDGRCDLGMMTLTTYERHEALEHGGLQVVHSFPAVPGLGMTASGRLSAVQHERILIALFSPPGQRALAPFLSAFEASGIEQADAGVFTGYAGLLRDERGFGDALDALAQAPGRRVARP